MLHLVDSHCHLNYDPLGTDLPAVLARAADNGVRHMLCVSVTLEAFPEVLQIAQRHSHIYASVGVHPNEREGKDPSVEELVALAQDDRIVAIGETGLDYYRNDGDVEWQKERFRRHLRTSKATAKPVIVHTRAAAEDTLEILKTENARDTGGVMHCFTESWDVARQALDLGFYISLSGIITFKSADSLREVARKVPADRLLIETDAPYLAPVPFRGKPNEPAFVRYVAECIAELRGEPLATLAEQTTQNFFRLFRIAH